MYHVYVQQETDCSWYKRSVRFLKSLFLFLLPPLYVDETVIFNLICLFRYCLSVVWFKVSRLLLYSAEYGVGDSV